MTDWIKVTNTIEETDKPVIIKLADGRVFEWPHIKKTKKLEDDGRGNYVCGGGSSESVESGSRIVGYKFKNDLEQ